MIALALTNWLLTKHLAFVRRAKQDSLLIKEITLTVESMW